MSEFSALMPFCLYHWVDKARFIYKSYIIPAIRKADGQYECMNSDLLSKDGWKLVSIFFAVNPSYKPIPREMQLFRVQRNKEFPYDVTDVNINYDIYNIDDNSVYFITYTKPVPNTIPLYIWKNNGSTFIDFASTSPPAEQNVPSKNMSHSQDISHILTEKGWSSALINPIYIIHPDVVGWDIENIKFQCNNGICMPINSKGILSIKKIFNTTKFSEPKVLHECVVSCSQLVNNKHNKPGRNLISVIRQNNLNSGEQTKKILYILGIIIFISIVIGLICFFIYRGR